MAGETTGGEQRTSGAANAGTAFVDGSYVPIDEAREHLRELRALGYIQ